MLAKFKTTWGRQQTPLPKVLMWNNHAPNVGLVDHASIVHPLGGFGNLTEFTQESYSALFSTT